MEINTDDLRTEPLPSASSSSQKNNYVNILIEQVNNEKLFLLRNAKR
jgi:hypothetical protein